MIICTVETSLKTDKTVSLNIARHHDIRIDFEWQFLKLSLHEQHLKRRSDRTIPLVACHEWKSTLLLTFVQPKTLNANHVHVHMYICTLREHKAVDFPTDHRRPAFLRLAYRTLR